MEDVIGIKVREPPKSSRGLYTFICISSMLVAAVNVRVFATGWAAFMAALAVSILYLGRKGLIARVRQQPILVALPAFFVISCLWSDEPRISLSLGLQTLLTTLAAISIANHVSRRQFLLIVFLATSAICLGCIAYGKLGASAHGMVLIGFLGSKDAMGLFAYISVMTSIALMFDRKQRRLVRICALALALIECRIAVSVHATTAVISLALGIASFLTIHLILSRSGIARWAIYFFIFIIMLSAICLSSEILESFMHTVTGHLGKSATLTGRTVLWEKALDLFGNAPFLGHGYRAFWVGSSADAHSMLGMMHLRDGRGFHFHEQYLETLVDTGTIGGIILLATFVTFAIKMWKNAINSPSYFAAYSMTIFIVYVFRWFFETAFLPFSFDMMMFYGLGTIALSNLKSGNRGATPLGISPNRIHPALLIKEPIKKEPARS